LNWTFGENKPKQSQFQNRGSLPAISVAGQMSENEGKVMAVYPPEAGQKTACPAGTAGNLVRQAHHL